MTHSPEHLLTTGKITGRVAEVSELFDSSLTGRHLERIVSKCLSDCDNDSWGHPSAARTNVAMFESIH